MRSLMLASLSLFVACGTRHGGDPADAPGGPADLPDGYGSITIALTGAEAETSLTARIKAVMDGGGGTFTASKALDSLTLIDVIRLPEGTYTVSVEIFKGEEAVPAYSGVKAGIPVLPAQVNSITIELTTAGSVQVVAELPRWGRKWGNGSSFTPPQVENQCDPKFLDGPWGAQRIETLTSGMPGDAYYLWYRSKVKPPGNCTYPGGDSLIMFRTEQIKTNGQPDWSAGVGKSILLLDSTSLGQAFKYYQPSFFVLGGRFHIFSTENLERVRYFSSDDGSNWVEEGTFSFKQLGELPFGNVMYFRKYAKSRCIPLITDRYDVFCSTSDIYEQNGQVFARRGIFHFSSPDGIIWPSDIPPSSSESGKIIDFNVFDGGTGLFHPGKDDGWAIYAVAAVGSVVIMWYTSGNVDQLTMVESSNLTDWVSSSIHFNLFNDSNDDNARYWALFRNEHGLHVVTKSDIYSGKLMSMSSSE
jgi:hypothetical protein